jgi:uncharacterized protein (TIGR02217 family)
MMSTAVFPTLPGLGFSVIRTPIWSNQIQQSVSGKKTSVALWSYPRHRWTLTYNYLRGDASLAEFQTLFGFFNARQGQFDTFQYQDADDNAVTGQQIALGDGATTAFQLYRVFAGNAEPIYAPHTVSKVYVDGVDKPGHWTVTSWGDAAPGIVTFDSAPASGKAITADFTYYWPCRFTTDLQDFEKFLFQLWKANGISFESEK